jgi:hypothetical protein
MFITTTVKRPRRFTTTRLRVRLLKGLTQRVDNRDDKTIPLPLSSSQLPLKVEQPEMKKKDVEDSLRDINDRIDRCHNGIESIIVLLCAVIVIFAFSTLHNMDDMRHLNGKTNVLLHTVRSSINKRERD